MDRNAIRSTESTRVHHAARRRGGGVAARGARAARRAHAAHRRAHEHGCGRSDRTDPPPGFNEAIMSAVRVICLAAAVCLSTPVLNGLKIASYLHTGSI